jgi:hypothetical protein
MERALNLPSGARVSADGLGAKARHVKKNQKNQGNYRSGNMLPELVAYRQQSFHNCDGHFSAFRLSHTVAANRDAPVMRLCHSVVICGALAFAAGLALAEPKDASRLLPDEEILTAQTTEPLPKAEEPPPATDEQISPDDMSLGEIPVVETMELTDSIAKRAIDVYVLVKEKYKDADLEQYENLQDFVDQNVQGKAFDADIKAAGFASVNDWNLAITTAGFAYTGVVDDQSADIKSQVEEITADTELAQDMKDRMIASLTAMIPSDNNRKVIQALIDDPAYAEKLKQLDTEEE